MILEKDESLDNKEKKIDKLQLDLRDVENEILKFKGERDAIIRQIEELKSKTRRRRKLKPKISLKTLKYLILIVILVSITAIELSYFDTIIPFSDLDMLLTYYPWVIPFILIFTVVICLIATILYLILFNAISRRIKRSQGKVV